MSDLGSRQQHVRPCRLTCRVAHHRLADPVRRDVEGRGRLVAQKIGHRRLSVEAVVGVGPQLGLAVAVVVRGVGARHEVAVAVVVVGLGGGVGGAIATGEAQHQVPLVEGVAVDVALGLGDRHEQLGRVVAKARLEGSRLIDLLRLDELVVEDVVGVARAQPRPRPRGEATAVLDVDPRGAAVEVVVSARAIAQRRRRTEELARGHRLGHVRAAHHLHREVPRVVLERRHHPARVGHADRPPHGVVEEARREHRRVRGGGSTRRRLGVHGLHREVAPILDRRAEVRAAGALPVAVGVVLGVIRVGVHVPFRVDHVRDLAPVVVSGLSEDLLRRATEPDRLAAVRQQRHRRPD